MFQHPFYLLYGALMLGTLTVAEWRGWSWQRINEVHNVPKTVRDNPGAYRSHYGYYPGRYIGGK